MATAIDDTFNNELDDLITCGVCLCQFDEDESKPKFLPCSHTVCVTCLREIMDGEKVICPFCRNITLQSLDVQNLPNNTYALHMLKLKEGKKSSTNSCTPNSKNMSWCFTCGSLAKPSCPLSEHCLFDMTLHTMKNIEAFIGLQEEFKKMNHEGTDKLAMALEKRKEIKKHLDMLVSSVTVTLDEIHGLQDQNNLEMAELASMIEKGMSKASANQTDSLNDSKELFLFDLKSFAENFSPEDTAQTLKLKVKKSLAYGEDKLTAATSEALKLEQHKKLRLTVNLMDENNQLVPSCPWLQDGFRLLNANGKDGLGALGKEARRKLLLLSHLVFSLTQKQKQGSSSQTTTTPSVGDTCPASDCVNTKEPLNRSLQSFVPNLSSSTSEQNVSRPSNLTKSCFTLGQSFFVLRIFKSQVPTGEVHIFPSATSSCGPSFVSFVEELGNFCFKSQKLFSQSISKAYEDVFVMIPMANSSFNPKSGASCSAVNPLHRSASSLNEVGFTAVKPSPTLGFGWSFVFPLQNYNVPKYEPYVKNLATNKFFGHVVLNSMLDSIIQISSLTGSARVGYSMTLESR